jgi:hypothetical protein
MKKLLMTLMLSATSLSFAAPTDARADCMSEVVPSLGGLLCLIDPGDGGELIEIPITTPEDIQWCLSECRRFDSEDPWEAKNEFSHLQPLLPGIALPPVRNWQQPQPPKRKIQVGDFFAQQ